MLPEKKGNEVLDNVVEAALFKSDPGGCRGLWEREMGLWVVVQR